MFHEKLNCVKFKISPIRIVRKFVCAANRMQIRTLIRERAEGDLLVYVVNRLL
jgi:hypothetical protein